MAPPSSYLRFLPPALYQDDPADPALSLGGFLRIVEKILTGIPDGVAVLDAQGNPAADVQSRIAGIARLFDPFRTPAAFLPYLASWVGLELPATWNEYQQRRVIAEIVGIYQQRGSRSSLQRYLDIYTAGDKRPLIFVNEGGQVFRATPVPGEIVPIENFLPHWPITTPREIVLGPDKTMFVGDEAFYPLVSKGVFRLDASGYHYTGSPPLPQRILPYIAEWRLFTVLNLNNAANGHAQLGTGTIQVAATVDTQAFPNGITIYIAATGVLGTATFAISTDPLTEPPIDQLPTQTIPANGQYGPDSRGIQLVFSNNGANPAFVQGDMYFFFAFDYSPITPLNRPPYELEILGWLPHCLAVDAKSPYHLYMMGLVDISSDSPNATALLFRLSSPDFLTSGSQPVATRGALGVQWPQAMLFHQNGHLMILDRGADIENGLGGTSVDLTPKPFIVEVTLDTAGLAVVSTTVHHLSTVQNPASMCMLSNGDLLVGDARDPQNPAAAELVRVSPANGWAETRPLAGVPNNPLVAPVAVVRDDDTHFYVLDAGLKPWDYFDDLVKRVQDPQLKTNGPLVPSDDKYNPFVRVSARAPAVYRVDLSGPTITQVTETGVLCRPAGMALLDGTLYITERGLDFFGELFDPVSLLASTILSSPSTFGVEINYTAASHVSPADQRSIYNTVAAIVAQEMPAHTRFLLISMVTTP